jgi:serine/threonine protein kinase
MPSLQYQLAPGLAGRYHLERELGQGGMAVVFLAQDLRHDRKVALKVLRPDLSAAIGAEMTPEELRKSVPLRVTHKKRRAHHRQGGLAVSFAFTS